MMEQEAKEEEKRAQEERVKVPPPKESRPKDPKGQQQKDALSSRSKPLMSDQNRRHFKQLCSFINAYRMKMT
jgi:hypothetical protein